MNPAKLKHIVAVDRFGSFTGAAKAVHITQSALTKSVAEIEAEVGFALFERHAKGVFTTSEGRTFIDRAARIVADIDQLSADTKAGRQLSGSRIRVGVCPPSLVSLLNMAMPQLILQFPELRLEQTAGWIDQSVQYLKNRDIDLLVGPAPSILQQSQFTVHPLADFAICFFVRKGHPLEKKARPQAKDLNRYPMALADKSVATPELTRQLFGAPEVPPEQRLHIIGHFPSACKIVAATDTIGTVGANYRNNEAFQQSFTILDIDTIEPIPLAIAYHSKWLPSPPMLSLIRILESEPHWAAGNQGDS
ncbi:transcriptional regulator [Spongiibacter sp. IMCC21906]|uniref:LysR family transcriptional regulator n=1 Tax=Spongiibacter sp. IMCC21906 TaxID=1620392 RepID=UPI00062DFCF5|nr:LysR family transcriptional regulator [Spongiibacter sp. IMCC21906]AKH68369.1 transcriptional regulator [Spongiibacter sp. IMCC21906]